jgi:hypothetical protein
MSTPSTINKINIFWALAQSVRNYDSSNLCKCDCCRRQFLSGECKVFHTFDSKKAFAKVISSELTVSTDHIFVCIRCKSIITNKWVACNCKYALQTQKTPFEEKERNRNKNKENICPA